MMPWVDFASKFGAGSLMRGMRAMAVASELMVFSWYAKGWEPVALHVRKFRIRHGYSSVKSRGHIPEERNAAPALRECRRIYRQRAGRKPTRCIHRCRCTLDGADATNRERNEPVGDNVRDFTHFRRDKGERASRSHLHSERGTSVRGSSHFGNGMGVARE